MDRDLKYWLALNRISGITWERLKSLLELFGGVKEIFKAIKSELMECKEITPPIASRIKNFDEWKEIDKELYVLRRLSVSVIPVTDADYPDSLRNIYDPPLILYYKGNKELLKNKCMAVVGSRHPTEYGIEVTKKLTGELVDAGFTIVSGFAQGIDSEAHRAAIASGGRTIAVFGSGIDVIYPAGNEELYELLVKSHLIVTEFPPGTKPFKGNFPRRNRIISGLSKGVVVVEATLNSGSLITARYALEQGRDVFAVPGMITSTRSQGCHYLIKEGARPVESVKDMIDDVSMSKKNCLNIDTLNLSEKEKSIVSTLRDGKKHIDIIIESVKMPSSDTAGILTNLELSGIVRQLPGKYFELRSD